MSDYEKKGYDSWVDKWCCQGSTPSLASCPAKYMGLGQRRSDFLRGWKIAEREFATTPKDRHEQ